VVSPGHLAASIIIILHSTAIITPRSRHTLHLYTHPTHTSTAMALDIDQTKFLEEAMRKVKEQAFYMKHAMVSLSPVERNCFLPAFWLL